MSDLISRQDAIDIVTFECGEWQGIANRINEQIQRLPSAQQEIVRCKDCKHYHTFPDILTVTLEDGISVHISWCDLGHSREIDIYDEWFCADAKPKEGEEDE